MKTEEVMKFISKCDYCGAEMDKEEKDGCVEYTCKYENEH